MRRSLPAAGRIVNAIPVAHHNRVEDRLLLTLWHLAERWGKVMPQGILLPLPLSHQRLAKIVGAHRPSVTTALGALVQGRASISRRDDGDWVLHGDPPEKLRHHKLAAALS